MNLFALFCMIVGFVTVFIAAAYALARFTPVGNFLEYLMGDDFWCVFEEKTR